MRIASANGLFCLLLSLALCVLAPVLAHAGDAYPARPVRIIVPFPAGDPSDLLARAFADHASESLGQKFLVENKPGAVGIIGTNFVAKSPADGYTLLVTTLAHTTNPYVNAQLPYDTRKDFAPVSMLGQSPGALFVVGASHEAKSMRDFILLARENPGKFSFANGGIGQMSGLAGELLKKIADIDVVSVPYQGAASYATDILTGRVDSGVMGLIGSVQFVQEGKLRALALTGPSRTPILPDVPTFRELGYPEMNLVGWFGVLAPAGVAPERIRVLSREAAQAVKTPAFRKLLDIYGIEASGSNADEFASFIDRTLDTTGTIIKKIGYVPK